VDHVTGTNIYRWSSRPQLLAEGSAPPIQPQFSFDFNCHIACSSLAIMMLSRLRHFLFAKSVANDGSQLRDHLANERTFLSWTRMGLAFAAMALALGRLGIIDRIFSRDLNIRSVSDSSTEPAKSTTARAGRERSRQEPEPATSGSNETVASQVCWAISVSSFGYGICRYVTVRRALLQGRFVPAIWGPVLMTCGSLGSLGILLQSGNWGSRNGNSRTS
jgi:hypothetical protein